jgi:hypothetical protein
VQKTADFKNSCRGALFLVVGIATFGSMVHGDMEIRKYGDLKTRGRGDGDMDTDDIDMETWTSWA